MAVRRRRAEEAPAETTAPTEKKAPTGSGEAAFRDVEEWIVRNSGRDPRSIVVDLLTYVRENTGREAVNAKDIGDAKVEGDDA